MKRRDALGLLGTGLGVAALGPSLISDVGSVRASNTLSCGLEGRRMRWLVGASIGGGYDLFSRLFEPWFERALSAEVAVENVLGAGGIVAARQVSEAPPDGLTLGLLNGTGLLVAPFTNPDFAPDLRADFTIYGGVAPHLPVFSVSRDSPIQSIEELVAVHRTKPLVVAGSGGASANLLACSIMEDLFGVRVEHLWGLHGTPAIQEAVIRGWADGTGLSEETMLRNRESFRFLLRFHDGSSGVGLEASVPSLTELIDEKPELFPDPERARTDAVALAAVLGVGRLVCGPPGLTEELTACLRRATVATLEDESFAAEAKTAGRAVVPLVAGEAHALIAIAERSRTRLGEVIRRTLARARGGG